MELKNQVCTLEQGKRLYELIEKDTESLFVHWLTIENEDYVWKIGTLNEAGNATESYPAYTVAELGEMLPEFCPSYKGRNDEYACVIIPWEVESGVISSEDLASAVDAGMTQIGHYEIAPTEAQARAAMLIYLLEQKLITPNQQK